MTDVAVPLRDAEQKRRRILVLMDSAAVSGPVRQLGAVIRPLSEMGYDLHCVVFQRLGKAQNSSSDFLRSMGAAVTTLTDKRAFDPRLIGRLEALIDECRPDVIETHGYRPSVLLTILRASKRIRCPWIGYFHGRTAESLSVKLYDKLDHLCLRFASLVVVMSELQRQEKSRYAVEVRILYNAAIEESPTSATSANLAERLAHVERPLVGVIGRLSPEKGVDVLLSAWCARIRDGQTGTLLVAGDGQERSRYEAYLTREGIHDRVVFLGHLDGTRNLYPMLRLLVIPSRSEGLPNVFIEAMRAGIRIVSTRVGALPELVGSTQAAMLVPIDDVSALSTAVATALSPEIPPDWARDSRALLDRLSLPSRVAAIAQTYRDVIRRVAV